MPRRVLLIDDEQDIREVAVLSLETVAGWTVFVAGSGEEGIAVAVAEQPDAILLDVMMPAMDGPTTFQRLRMNEATSAIPVIFLTAKVQPAEQRQFVELGVRGVIAKPFDPLRLAHLVAEQLGWDAPS
jgi:CheY-like chemotaxis protein